MKKIKVLYVVSTLRRSGPTNQLLGIISNMDTDKFDLRIITLSSEPNNTRLEEFVNKGIDVDSLELSRIKGFLSGLKKLKNKISEFDPDVVHTSGVRADDLVARLESRMKFSHVMTIRNFAIEDYKAKFGNIIGYLLALKGVKTILKGKIVVFCSYSLKNKYKIYNIKEKNTNVIQNGVNTENFKPLNLEDKVLLKKKLGFNFKDKIVIYTGSLIQRKNPLTLIQAFQKNKDPNAILLMLGDGALSEECKKLSSEKIRILGEVSNVKDYLSIADLFVSPSSSEGLPNSVIEAASMNLPLLLSDIPEHREIKGNDNKSIIEFFDHNDLNSLSNEITNLINKDVENIDNRNHIIHNFSMKEMSNKYAKLYVSNIK